MRQGQGTDSSCSCERVACHSERRGLLPCAGMRRAGNPSILLTPLGVTRGCATPCHPERSERSERSRGIPRAPNGGGRPRHAYGHRYIGKLCRLDARRQLENILTRWRQLGAVFDPFLSPTRQSVPPVVVSTSVYGSGFRRHVSLCRQLSLAVEYACGRLGEDGPF